MVLRKVSGWTSGRGLSVNNDRTEVVLSTRRYKPVFFRPLRLHEDELKLREEAHFLILVS